MSQGVSSSRRLHAPWRAWGLPLLAVALASGCLAPNQRSSFRPVAKAPATAAKPSTSPSPRPSVGLKPSPGSSPLPVASGASSFSGSVVPGPKASPSPDAPLPPLNLQPLRATVNGVTRQMAVASNAALQQAAADLVVEVTPISAWRLLGWSAPASPKPTRLGPLEGHAAIQAALAREVEGLLAQEGPPAYRLLAQAAPPALGSRLPFNVVTRFAEPDNVETTITGVVKAIGTHVVVVVDEALLQEAGAKASLDARVGEMVQTFDEVIYPLNTQTFGSEPKPGVDGVEPIFLLISPAVGDYGKDSTLGYFAQRDCFPARGDGPKAIQRSNAKEMIYVSSRIVLEGAPDDYLGTVAHEFQHMINFNQKVLVGRNRVSEDLWIDEGMAMYAIEATGYGLFGGGAVLGAHVKAFQADPGGYSLTEWEGNPEGSGYGAVYLLMVYLADRFGPTIIREIVTSSTLGMSNLDQVLAKRGTTFARVFHDWAAANAIEGLGVEPEARHAYKNLRMRGVNGATRLRGFATQSVKPPVRWPVSLRPYSFSLLETPTLGLPTFSWAGVSGPGQGVQARLVYASP